MKKMALALAMAFVLLATSVAEANGRHRGGHYRGSYYRGSYGWGGFGVYPRVFIGGSYGWGNPYPYYSYPYYPRPVVIERSEPQVYVQQPQPELQYWYYCENPKGYYPSVKTCRNEWLKVVPRSDAPNE